MNTKLKIGGIFKLEQIRNGEVVASWEEPNIVVDEGLNYVLGSGMAGVTQNTSWYVSLFKNNYTPLAANVAATFFGNGVAGEVTTEYSESTRRPWTTAGVVSASITNSASAAVFTFASPVTVYGSALVSAPAKSATTGVLAAASRFSSPRDILAGDSLSVTYTLSIASA